MTGNQEGSNQPEDVHADFRQDLKVVIAVVRKLAPHCKSPEDIVEMLELGLRNDGQVAILLDMVAPVTHRK